MHKRIYRIYFQISNVKNFMNVTKKRIELPYWLLTGFFFRLHCSATFHKRKLSVDCGVFKTSSLFAHFVLTKYIL
jgi:hypothetical protein